MPEGGDPAARLGDPVGVDLGVEAADLFARVQQYLAPGRHDEGMAPGLAFLGMHAGLRRRDVIIEANREPTPSVEDLEKALDADADRALLLVRRGDGTMFVAIGRE